VKDRAWLAAVLFVIVIAQALAWRSSEPFYNNDETRHVMTGVFVHDLLVDRPLDRPKDYAIQYYLQYPALGLVVWPPLFYGVEGIVMLVAGTALPVAKALIAFFSALALIYFFLLVRRTHGMTAAAVSTLLFGFAPLVFLLSQHVMLEIPALAFALAAIFHFVVYLELGRRLDVFIAAVAAAGFALTRYDAFFLILFFVLSLVALRRFDVLRRGTVWLASLIALALVLPVYLQMMVQFGQTHLQVTVEGGAGPSPGFFQTLVFYPKALPRQVGGFIAVAGLAGLLSALRPARRRACWPYLALAAATYLSFTPLAEREPRHAIYWIPAFALFAWEGIDWIASRLPHARPVLSAILICGTLWSDTQRPSLYVRGYEEAARYVVANTRSSRFTFMDGFLNGGFIYQVRRHDPGRRLWVLRGDKLLYGVLNDPNGSYKEYAGGEGTILEILYRYDPEFLVIEEPQVRFKIPMAEQLRRTLAAHPERFERVKSIPIESNVSVFQGVRLDIYRSKVRNPHPERRLEVDMIGLGRALGTEVP
jgi:Dolichyl-phosphate-mannose-protein mannosyltransferase